MRWDVFCRVIDNHGDLGVCWRLAADLASRGQTVRLWVDDASALAWMAPHGAPGVESRTWPLGDIAAEPYDVVVEAFGCALPEGFVARMERTRAVWINLEYLSAQPYVERSHALPSPQRSGPPKWFFYPGFSARTGGLLREPGLAQWRQTFRADDWLAAHGLARQPAERVIGLFCYRNPVLPALLQALQDRPTLLMACAGLPAQQVEEALGPSMRLGRLRAVALPHVDQAAFDGLLRVADVDFVRGEDSLVRAIWSGRPFVWQIYPQADGAHVAKLLAMLDLMLAGVPAPLAQAVRGLWLAWNGLGDRALAWPDEPTLQAWAGHAAAFCDRLQVQDDLCTQLLRFAAERR
jgi:uncharacterized repeat protein (TIGR03837 family)